MVDKTSDIAIEVIGVGEEWDVEELFGEDVPGVEVVRFENLTTQLNYSLAIKLSTYLFPLYGSYFLKSLFR